MPIGMSPRTSSARRRPTGRAWTAAVTMAAISVTGAVTAFGAAAKVAAGIPENCASSGSCTTTTPPASATTAAPTAPSSSAPDKDRGDHVRTGPLSGAGEHHVHGRSVSVHLRPGVQQYPPVGHHQMPVRRRHQNRVRCQRRAITRVLCRESTRSHHRYAHTHHHSIPRSGPHNRGWRSDPSCATTSRPPRLRCPAPPPRLGSLALAPRPGFWFGRPGHPLIG